MSVSGASLAAAASRRAASSVPPPFERTALNGFGFVQIIRPRQRASLVELAQDRAGFEARALLRRAIDAPGSKRLVAHPAVIGVLQRQATWLDALARQVGGTISSVQIRAITTLIPGPGRTAAQTAPQTRTLDWWTV